MITRLAYVCLIVDDYDKALQWYTEKLGLEVRANRPYGPQSQYRWITVGTQEQQDLEIVLHKPDLGHSDPRLCKVGQVTHWVFYTDDCHKEVNRLKDQGVKIIREPEQMPWGLQAIFEDLYGNTFVLTEQPTKIIDS